MARLPRSELLEALLVVRVVGVTLWHAEGRGPGRESCRLHQSRGRPQTAGLCGCVPRAAGEGRENGRHGGGGGVERVVWVSRVRLELVPANCTLQASSRARRGGPERRLAWQRSREGTVGPSHHPVLSPSCCH